MINRTNKSALISWSPAVERQHGHKEAQPIQITCVSLMVEASGCCRRINARSHLRTAQQQSLLLEQVWAVTTTTANIHRVSWGERSGRGVRLWWRHLYSRETNLEWSGYREGLLGWSWERTACWERNKRWLSPCGARSEDTPAISNGCFDRVLSSRGRVMVFWARQRSRWLRWLSPMSELGGHQQTRCLFGPLKRRMREDVFSLCNCQREKNPREGEEWFQRTTLV